MGKIRKITGIVLFALLLGGFGMTQQARAAEGEATKKAILVVSFGTTYPDTLQLTIESVENKIRATYPDYEVRRAFTSRKVIKKWAERDGIQFDTEKEALDKLSAEGYDEVYVQPLHIVAGEEYDKVKKLVAQYAQEEVFARISLGRPLLFYLGQEGKPDDYAAAIAAIHTQLPQTDQRADAVVFMGHGGVHPANAAYAALQLKFDAAKLKNVYIYTVEGFPALEDVIAKLKQDKATRVVLMPFMLVAGDHAVNDMAGADKESAQSILRAAGFQVDTYIHGLGENHAIQEIYLQHLAEAMATATRD